jgi:uncharacterized protein
VAGKQPRRKPRPGVDEHGRTALHYAAADGQASAVRTLLNQGADPNQQDDDGWTPPHFAAQATSAEATRLLLAAGAATHLTDSFGNTALLRAVFSSQGHGAVIALLMDAGADPCAANSSGVSPVGLARTIANFDVAQFFSDVTCPHDS